MNIYTKDNHTVIEANRGMFLMRKNRGYYAEALSLGVTDDASNYDELPMSEMPEPPAEPVFPDDHVEEPVDNEIE